MPPSPRRWWSRLRRSLHDATHRRAVERDLDDEIRDHLDREIAANLVAGMSPDEARRAALAAFGGVQRIKDETREARGLTVVDSLARLQLSWRALRRARAFTTATTLTVALTVAAGPAAYTVLDGILLHPLPYPHADRLVGLWHSFPGIGMSLAEQAPGTYWTYQRDSRSFASIGAYAAGAATIEVPGPSPVPARQPVAWVTASLFRTLGTRPLLGRLFAESDDRTGAPPMAILSEQAWRSEWHADSAVVGQTVDVDGTATEIIGVVPESFAFPASNLSLWLPFPIPRNQYLGYFNFRAIGRLRPGVTLSQAEQEMQQLLSRVAEAYPEQVPGVSTASALRAAKPVVVLHPMRTDVVGGFSHLVWLIVATVAVMILVAFSNVGSLALARLEARQPELAVRTTLGASRGQVWASVAGEALLVCVLGGIIGAVVGGGALSVLGRIGPTVMPDPMLGGGGHVLIPRLNEIHPGMSFIAAAGMLTTAFWVEIGLIGAWRTATSDPANLLRERGRTSTGGRATQALRTALVAIEVAMSVTLLGGAAVLGRSVLRLRAVQPGFDPQHVLTFWTSPPPGHYRSLVDISQFYHRALDAIRAIPGVADAGTVTRLPLDPGYWGAELVHVEHAPPRDGLHLFALGATVGDYFSAMRIPLLAGRTFDDDAIRAGAHEAVVTRGFAELYWHDSTGQRAIGQRLRPRDAGPWYTIVGVVGAVRDTALTAPATDEVYFREDAPTGPNAPAPAAVRDMAFAVRTTAASPQLAAEVRRAIRGIAPSVPIYDLATMTTRATSARRSVSLMLLLIGVGAGATLVLGVVGLYGVIAYMATLRTPEIGIRIALGLTPRGAVRLLLAHGAAAVGVGAIVGVTAFAGFGRLLRTLSFGVSPVDPACVATAAAVTIIVAMLAVSIPARRAARIDLMRALGSE